MMCFCDMVQNFEPMVEAVGPYDTEEEATLVAQEYARRRRGQGYDVSSYYAVKREDGLWDAVIEYSERPQIEQVQPLKAKKSTWALAMAGILGAGILSAVAIAIIKNK